MIGKVTVRSQDKITVVTPTMGDSCGHLNRQMLDMKCFTDAGFYHVVSDDGTLDEGQRRRQQDVCGLYHADWTENPGPVWGISYNLNHALSKVTTPWALLAEDGIRPSLGWLETALDAVEQIGERRWRGFQVGCMGMASFEDWHLALAGVLPGGLPPSKFWAAREADAYGAFWGSADHPNWNDGLWCWRRLLPAFREACARPEAAGWPDFVQRFRSVILTGESPAHAMIAGRRPRAAWPRKRTGSCAWFPCPFMLLSMGAWREAGRMRDGCTFFEGHLGVRMAQHGYLCLDLETPPWLHFPGMGFIAGARGAGRTPRHHELCDGDDARDILFRDFGRNGPGHADLYGLVYQTFPQALQDEINKELAAVSLWMHPEWKQWL